MTPREVPSVLQLDLPPPTSPLLSEGEFASSLLEVIDSYSLSNDDDDSSSGKSDLDNRISLDTVRSSEVTLTESLDKLRPDIRRGSEDIKRDGRFKRESDDKLKRDSAISVHRKPVLRFDKSDSNLTEFPLHELVQVEPTHVYLEANRIASINLKHSVLSHLRVLDLSRNVLAELPQEIGNLTSLEDLSLDYNALVSLPQSFCQLKQLKSLSVAHNQIKSLDFNLFSQFGKLEYLDLSHNQLQSLPPSLGYCGTLKTLLIILNLSGNQLQSVQGIEKLRTLQQLDLSNNALVEIPNGFSKLKHLKYLYLQHNQIDSIGLEFDGRNKSIFEDKAGGVGSVV
ncbi:hypothetical protein EDD86DRAFT_196170 [Gorgonomyces haynaldii]|nr:hypothetical protein EDD86DRAFT_196170 [Gorgonomyces haynaldii]